MSRNMHKHNVAGGIEHFWKDFPLTDIHDCITPDILHQCYQGVFKHLLKWVQEIVGENELDEQFQVLPPTCGVRHFKKGIADFSQVTGTEHKHIARILLASLTGKVDQRGIIACKALLNFIHLAQYPSHDEYTLGYMDLELNVWHKNKAYFVKQQTTKDQINIPKFHSLLHYVNSIKWLGTTDNYNTEAFERFHIDMAKEAWDATNKRDHFPQMTQWLSRQEKILSFDFYRNWINSTSTNQGAQKNDITLKLDTNIRIAKHPHEIKKSLNAIANSHNAPGCLPFTLLDVWHHFKFTPVNLFDDASDVPKEIVRAAPSSIKKNSKSKSKSRYDTVIILINDEAESTAFPPSI
ncbi:hypothetical protein BDP27DRAFT_1386570 [Rhodocollybia butyracea]|uniref:Uncharacterized protein n=1 Tax=Rhodocollybia butyracea TaxID=206335 RepID=A0A9P5TWV7_9AGAR|nr:hypothetical protein BDP27DRAFT_1386570 [Rhodocollybia butyracea]